MSKRFLPISFSRSRIASAACAALLGVLGGCGNVHHIEVGAVPDDYRTRHPIIVGEAPVVIDIPVSQYDGRLSLADRKRIETTADRFHASGADTLQVLVPSGSLNQVAAERLSAEVVETLRARRVDRARILVRPYAISGSGAAAPIRLAYTTLTAEVAPCGRWPEDLGRTHENKNYFNFGCATQNNLAAQIADPRDLLSPRGVDSIDAQRRTTVLDNYRQGKPTGTDYRDSDVGLDF